MKETLLKWIRYYQSDFLKIVITLFVFSFLNEPIVNFFNDVIVDDILSKFSKEGTIWLTIIYMTMMIVLVYISWIKLIRKKYQTSIYLLFLSSCTSALYVYERLIVKNYVFYPLLTIRHFTLAQGDLITVVLALLTILLLVNYFLNRIYPANVTFFIQDIPLRQVNGDEYGRRQFYDDVVKKLKDVAFDSDKGFAMGINSAWGFGKTSLLQIVQTQFKDEKKIVCVPYNPWLSANKASLTYDFFSVIEEKLSQYISRTDIVLRYAKKVSKFDNDKNPIKDLGELFEKDQTLEQRFESISKLIKQVNRQFFIIIDDLDRLDNDEVFEVLRLIRNVANFPRLNYIAAYDKRYLINALKEKKIHEPTKYLEKIFELEIELPKIDEHNIRDILSTTIKKGLEKLANSNELIEYQAQISNLVHNAAGLTAQKIANIANYVPFLFKNKRDILKFSNSLLFSFSMNKGSIYLPDLFAIELIKFSDSSVYELLASSNRYLEIYMSGTPSQQYFRLYPTSTTSAIPNDPRGTLFNILSLVNDERLKILIKSLYTIPELNDIDAKKSIVDVNSFSKYYIFATAAPQA